MAEGQEKNYGVKEMPEQNNPIKNSEFDPNFSVETVQENEQSRPVAVEEHFAASQDEPQQNIAQNSSQVDFSQNGPAESGEEQKSNFPILTVSIIILNILIFAWVYFFVPYKETTIENIFSCARKAVPTAFDRASEKEYQICKQYISNDDEVCLYTPNEDKITFYRSKIINACVEGRQKIELTWGTVPGELADPAKLITLITSMFMHGSWSHVLGNMIFLLISGCYVEYKLGKRKFLAVYFLSGIVGDFAFACFNSDLFVPLVGASGSIMGLLGANLVINGMKDLKLSKVNLFGYQSYGLASWFIILMMIMQIGNLALYGKMSSVAYLVHIASFIVGVLYVICMNKLGFLEDLKEKKEVDPVPSAPIIS